MYVDLRPWNTRPVEVLVEGVWLLAELEAYRRDATGWHGFVRRSEGPGLNRLDWVGASHLRRPATRDTVGDPDDHTVGRVS